MAGRGAGSKTTAVILALVTVFVLLSSLAYFQGTTVDAQLAPNVVATTISGAVDTANPGHESFWNQIASTTIPLTSSNDFGGATKSVTVKMVNNGTHILVYATWTDPTQSRIKHDVIENESFPGLFYANSSYSYEDRIVFWWSLSQNPGPPPCMQKSAYGHGEGESLAGTGNLWHWKGARTDSLGGSYGKLKYNSGPNKGQPLLPAHSYADNEFINTTGHYQLGWDQYPTATAPGNFTVGFGESSIPYNTFLVYAHGVYNTTSNSYTWEAARSLHTTPTLHTVQFTPNNTYYFAVAVFDGGPIQIPSTVRHPAGWSYYGENEETKSISSWYTMAVAAPAAAGATTTATATVTSTVTQTGAASTVTQTGATSTVTQAAAPGGIAPETALYVSVATLIVGLVAGLGAAWFVRPKK